MSVLGWIIVTVVIVLVGFYLWGDHLNRHPEKLAPIRAAKEEFAVERERAEFEARLARVEVAAQRRQDAAVLEATRAVYAEMFERLPGAVTAAPAVRRDDVTEDVDRVGADEWWSQAAGRP